MSSERKGEPRKEESPRSSCSSCRVGPAALGAGPPFWGHASCMVVLHSKASWSHPTHTTIQIRRTVQIATIAYRIFHIVEALQ